MILSLILVAVSLGSAATLAIAVTNEEAGQAAKAVFDRRGLSGMPLGCLLPLVGLAIAGLWTWYAIDVGDWRFAAITWIPFVCSMLAKLAMKTTKPKAAR